MLWENKESSRSSEQKKSGKERVSYVELFYFTLKEYIGIHQENRWREGQQEVQWQQEMYHVEIKKVSFE